MKKKAILIISAYIALVVMVGISYWRWQAFTADYYVNIYVYYTQEGSTAPPLILSDEQIEQLDISAAENYDTLTLYASSYEEAMRATERIVIVETVKNSHDSSDYLTGCSAETVWDSLVTGKGMFRLYLEHCLGNGQRDLDIYFYPVVREKHIQLSADAVWVAYHSAIQAELWASVAVDGLTESGAPARVKQQENESIVMVSSRNYLDHNKLMAIARENQKTGKKTIEKWW